MFLERIDLTTDVNDDQLEQFHVMWREILHAECHRHEIWGSPFVTTLASEQTPSHVKYELAAVWSINMVHGSYCFPRYVAALASRAEQDVVRHGLLENAWDESGGPHHRSRSHFWLAVELAQLIGLSDDEIAAIEPIEEASAYTRDHFEECASGDFAVALGMISLIEEFTTREFSLIFSAFLDSCSEGAGMAAQDFVLRGGAEYFTANISDDERHREEMPRLVCAYLGAAGVDCTRSDDLAPAMERIRSGFRRSIDLRARFFAGIHRFVEEGGTHRELIARTASKE